MADEQVLEWSATSLVNTPANEAAILTLVASTPELRHLARVLDRDRVAIGSRAPYFRAETADGDVILKLNLSAAEVQWSTLVGLMDPTLAPRTYGSGTLVGTEITWLLQERVSTQVGTSRHDNAVMMRSGARFQLFGRDDSAPAAPGGHPQEASELVAELFAAARVQGAPPAVGVLAEQAEAGWERLLNAIVIEWCHGDLHPGNVVRRAPDAPGLLIGFNPRKAPWIFDAGWLAGTALVLDVKPLYRWLFDLLRVSRSDLLGDDVPDRDFERAVTLVGAWFAVMCWRRQPPDRRQDRRLLGLIEQQANAALA